MAVGRPGVGEGRVLREVAIAGTRRCPETKRAVDVHPRAALVRQRNEIAKSIEAAGVELSRLQDDDRWSTRLAVERRAQCIDVHALVLVEGQHLDAVTAHAEQ